MESIQDRVLRVVATTCRKPLELLKPESTFEELGIDSLDRLNTVFELEGAFDIRIDDEQAKTVKDMRELVAGIERLVAAKTEPPSLPSE